MVITLLWTIKINSLQYTWELQNINLNILLAKNIQENQAKNDHEIIIYNMII